MSENQPEQNNPGNVQGNPDPQDVNINATLSKIKNKIIIMSGKGGVGKSSFAANLSVSLARKGFPTGLLDVDLHGPSIAGILGIKGLLDVHENQKVIPKPVEEHLKVVSMQSLMKDPDQAVIWRGRQKQGSSNSLSPMCNGRPWTF